MTDEEEAYVARLFKHREMLLDVAKKALDAYNKFDYYEFPTVKELENAMESIRAALSEIEGDENE